MATAAVMRLTSPAGPVSFLREDDDDMKVYALNLLNDNVDILWPELTESLKLIERIQGKQHFPKKDLAALLLAKIYYHNEQYGMSMSYALQAGRHFTFDKAGQFEYTTISKCIESYIILSRRHYANTVTSQEPVSPAINLIDAAQEDTPSRSAFASRSFLSKDVKSFESDYSLEDEEFVFQLPEASQDRLIAGIQQIFENCFKLGGSYYNYVVGVAIEARDLKVVTQAVLRAADEDERSGTNKAEELVEYILDICMNVVQERDLRNQLLELTLKHLTDIANIDHFSIARCVVYLGNYTLAYDMLTQLVNKGDAKSVAIAYQISFDLNENGTQKFLRKVIEQFEAVLPKASTVNSAGAPPASESAESATASGDNAPVDVKQDSELSSTQKCLSNVCSILSGDKSVELNLEFLYRSNHYDNAILDRIRASLDTRVSIYHSALTLANAFMNAGTTNDALYRTDREWLEKANCWSKFTAIAALGVIHRGHITQARNLLNTYLPGQTSGPVSSSYCQGGSLYALGLIYSNNGSAIVQDLQGWFVEASGDHGDGVVQHGAALGLGLAGMATASEDLITDLRTALDNDSATSGDAIGIAMGLVMLGTGNNDVLKYMLRHAYHTEHEKIVRGLGLGMALTMYARNESANPAIEKLLDSSDSNLRYGGVMMIAMAYCGSGSNSAVRELLSLAVSDVNDDVRRVAVMSLGFVLFRKPESVPRLVELLADSYNPNVRYGAAMALGIACAGTGLEEALDILEPMLKDSVDFVRQGALISLAMILVQQNEAVNPKVTAIRKNLSKIIGGRHEDSMTKFGCALALGIIDAGGRNCTISLQTQSGNLNMNAIVGMVVFTQYWYWFPLANFLSLAFTPTAIIAVDSELKVPSFSYHCGGKQSLFDYTPATKVKAEEAPEKVRAAVLSTTARAQRRLAKKRQATLESSGMVDVDPLPVPTKDKAVEDDQMDVDAATEDGAAKSAATEAEEKAKEEKAERLKEKAGFELENMSRVLPNQARYISFSKERYLPVKKPTGGVIVVHDSHPEKTKELVELKVLKRTTAAAPQIDRTSHFETPHGGGGGGNSATAAVLASLAAAAQPGNVGGAAESNTGPIAPVPQDFDYITDGEDEEEEDERDDDGDVELE